MKKIIVSIAGILLMSAMVLPVYAEVLGSEVYTSGNFEYIILPDGNIKLTKCYGNDSRISISSEIDGYEITEFADYLFTDKTELESVTIWADITDFGTGTFSGCTKLEKISIPSSTSVIRESLFEGCKNLETVTIWGDVTEIGERAFKDCSSLKKISIPSSTEMIGKSAFENCTGLKTVTLWGGNTIGDYAFRNCSKLKEISIPSEIETIGEGAFADCVKLSRVTLWNDETDISRSAFYNCPKLEGFGAYTQEPPESGEIAEAADTESDQENGGFGNIISDITDSIIDAVKPSDGVTLENFNKIDSSMTYEDVCALFGKEGELLSEVDIGIAGYETQMYAWYDWTGIFNCTVMFQGGYETSKSQFGLE